MNKIKILNEIKKLMTFGMDEKSFVDAKSGENIVRVEADDFTVGADIFVVGDEGVIPAPDGNHTLEDGRTLTVSGGKITEIELPEPGEEELIEEETEIEMEEITPEEKEQEKESAMKKMADMEKKIEDMEEVIKEMIRAYGEMKNYSKDIEGKLNDFVNSTPKNETFSQYKSEYKTLVSERKSTELSSLDKIHQLRKK
jgi:K+/H+ antiporter YhaU regulatory subunit KhtT